MAKGRPKHWRDPAKEQRWRRLLGEWRAGGLSVRQFCRRRQLSEPLFYAWRRELAKRDREASRRTRRAPHRVSGAPAFLPVQVVSSTPHEPRLNGALEVQLPTNVLLRIPAGFDRQTLTDVLRALRNEPC